MIFIFGHLVTNQYNKQAFRTWNKHGVYITPRTSMIMFYELSSSGKIREQTTLPRNETVEQENL